MAHAPSFAVSATPRVTHRPSAKILPFRAARAWLDIVLEGPSFAQTRSHLALLLHSPLGVYVKATRERGDSITVRLDIAPEDFGFTLHMLLKAVPAATVGALRPRINTGAH